MSPFDFLLNADLTYKIGVGVACLLFCAIVILLLRSGGRGRHVPPPISQQMPPAQPQKSTTPQMQQRPPLQQQQRQAPTQTGRSAPRLAPKRECPSCHFQNFEDAVFCSMCGFSFIPAGERKKEVQEKSCTFCGKPMPLDALVCPSCKKDQGASLAQLEEEKKRIKADLKQVELRYAMGQIDPGAYRYTKEQLKSRLVDLEDKITEVQVHSKRGKD